MRFNNFNLNARPFLNNAYCGCGNLLKEVSDGFISSAWFCPKCENVYTLKLIKVPKKKVNDNFLKQARKEA